jgi:hypothetical protein
MEEKPNTTDVPAPVPAPAPAPTTAAPAREKPTTEELVAKQQKLLRETILRSKHLASAVATMTRELEKCTSLCAFLTDDSQTPQERDDSLFMQDYGNGGYKTADASDHARYQETGRRWMSTMVARENLRKMCVDLDLPQPAFPNDTAYGIGEGDALRPVVRPYVDAGIRLLTPLYDDNGNEVEPIRGTDYGV